MNKCEKCGFLHYRTDPCRRPKESASGRKTDADRPLGRLPPKSASNDKSGRSQNKSTAARKDVPVIIGQAQTARGGHERTEPEPGTKGRQALSKANLELATLKERRGTKPKLQILGAGTQDLPVDTNSQHAKNEIAPISQTMPSTTFSGTVGDKDRKPKFDKKAWMREYMREYMRKRRAK